METLKPNQCFSETFETLKPNQYVDSSNYLGDYVNAYGNSFLNKLYFIAVQFKRPVMKYRAIQNISAPVVIPDRTILLVQGDLGNIVLKNYVLLFRDARYPRTDPSGLVAEDSQLRSLLLALFPPSSVLFIHFQDETLYAVTNSNPFSSFWNKCRRDDAFRALCRFFNATMENRALDLEEVSSLRLFKRQDPKCFSSWLGLAKQLCMIPFQRKMSPYSKISADLGNEIYQVLRRTERYLPLPPEDFYECELMLTDSEPLGICCVADQSVVVYISPMVVSRPPQKFKDANYIDVDQSNWYPLYRSSCHWKRYGLHYYTHAWPLFKSKVLNILQWLSVQTLEKYKFMYMDFLNVAYILLGEDYQLL